MRSSSKTWKAQNFIPFFVLLSFLVCINAESKFQTGSALFKTAFKVELFSCFDGRPITRARKKILAVKMKYIDLARAKSEAPINKFII